MAPAAGTKFAIEPADGGWRWATFDLSGAPLEGGRAGSKREAAALVIRGILKAALPQLDAPIIVEHREAA